MLASDRRRLNPPAGHTTAPVFASSTSDLRPKRSRAANVHRRIFLKTGVVPSAAGSAYYELQPDPASASATSFAHITPALKLSVTVHGPRPLPRNAAFSPNLLLTTHVKFAPFATRTRRGYVRDASERDLGAHLQNALQGVIIGDRWPKGAVDVVVTILEGEDGNSGSSGGDDQAWGLMSVLAGAVTASSAALVEAGIDCVDLVSGGVAGIGKRAAGSSVLIDPVASEQDLEALCVVSYLQSRDEVTEIWMRGDAGPYLEELVQQAITSAQLERTVLAEVLREMAEARVEEKQESNE